MKIICYVMLFLSVLAFSTASFASESSFGYVYTLDLLPKGAMEYEQYQTLRTGKKGGAYTAVDFKNEFEIGISDNFQFAFYVNSSYQNISGFTEMADRYDYNFDGLSAEFLYRILSPYKDSVGLGIYFEPVVVLRSSRTGEDENERKLETRIILHKNFMDDQLITALNLEIEPEWVKEDGDYTKELELELSGGASYRLVDHWQGGVEFRNIRAYDQMNLGRESDSALYMGPNVHYGSKDFWWTLSVMPKLNSLPKNSLAYDNLETRMVFSIPLGED